MNKKNPRRRIYLLPNLLTTAALFSGFYAIVAATQNRFEIAAVAIFFAMLMDGLDGRIARITHTETEFGAQYDSISDMVSFGLAPALIMYEWALSSMGEYDWYWGKLGWLAAFVYVAGAALRLARFNTQDNKLVFKGLASPAAAAIMVGLVWVGDDLGYTGNQLNIIAFVVTLLCGLLMVSRFSYYSFKGLNLRSRVSFTFMTVVILVLVMTSIDPPKILFIFFVLYMLSGPMMALIRKLRKRNMDKGSNDSD